MGTRRAALQNLDKAMMNWRRPRPWRSKEETHAIKRLVWLWFNCCGPGQTRESIHNLSRVLQVSRSYIQKLLRAFEQDPSEMQEEDRRRGPATVEQLERAREYTRRMREHGELRPHRRRF